MDPVATARLWLPLKAHQVSLMTVQVLLEANILAIVKVTQEAEC